MKVDALDFEALWGAITSGEDFEMCYADGACIFVEGWISGGIIIGAVIAETCFWLYVAITARVLYRHRKKKLKQQKASRSEFEKAVRGP